jgi:hypothetical protein
MVRVRVVFGTPTQVAYAGGNPHPGPLPEYMGRGIRGKAIALERSGRDFWVAGHGGKAPSLALPRKYRGRGKKG